MDQPKILFLVAHPHLHKSSANRVIVETIGTPDRLTIHNLYDVYPYFHIDVPREQKLLLAHDLIVMQHPLYWYGMPPLLKMWLDEVFALRWAYGSGGDKLKGKDFLISITVGGPQSSYSTEGHNRFPIETFLLPWNQTAHLCQMKWNKPRILFQSLRASHHDLTLHAQQVSHDLHFYLHEGRLP